jgi:hypothetical protein
LSIHTGSFFSKGESHLINQDYVVSTRDGIVLSDGCSSSQNSDVGSRVLAHSYLAAKDSQVPWFNTIHRALSTMNLLRLPGEALCATLLTAELVQHNICVNVWGDGCIVARRKKDGVLEYFNISFLSSAPYYIFYHAHQKESYIYQFGDKVQINKGYPFSFFERYPEGYIKLAYPIEAYDLVAVFSDGISSFRSATGELIPIESIAEEILAFKGTAGAFVERRCRRAFSTFEKNGWHNYDDFSVGVIVIQ